MADSDSRVLKIFLQFLADTAGISQSKAAVQDLQRTLESSNGGGLLAPIPKELLEPGPMKELGENTAFAGVQMSKLRNEATTLAREIATGTVNMRTVSALFGSLGFELAAVGVAAFAVLAGINKWVTGIVDAAVEQGKFSAQLDATVIQAYQIANLATKFEDVVKAEEKMLSPMDKLIDKLREAQKPVVALKAFMDAILTNPQSSLDIGASAPISGPITAGRNEEAKKLQAQIQQVLVEARQARADAEQAIDAFKSRMDESVSQRITEITQKLAALTKEEAALDEQSKKETNADNLAKIKSLIDANEKSQVEYNKRLEDAKGDLDDLTKSAGKMGDEIQRADLSKLSPQEKVDALKKQIEDTTQKLKELGAESPIAAEQLLKDGQVSLEVAKDMGVLVAEIERLKTELASAEKAAASEGSRSERKDLLADLKQQENLLQGIRQQQELTKSAPFLSTDQKDAQNLRQMIDELQALLVLKQKLEADQKKVLDPAQVEQVNGKLQQTNFEIAQLGQKIAALQAPIAASLVQWANQFDSITKQISTALTGTLNTAIGGTSNAIMGLINGTKNWQQAFGQAAQSIVQNLIQIALQYVVSKLIMAAIDKATGQSSGAAATTAAGTAAAAWAPAAISASIASYGAASETGTAAYLLALSVGEAAATGISAGSGAGRGFELGGYTGEDGGFVHPREFVFSEPAVRNVGIRNLEAAHESAKSMSAGPSAQGGRGGGGIHIGAFVDRQKVLNWFKDRDGTKLLVDVIGGHVRHLGA